MKTQITNNENQLLKQVQIFTAEWFGSDSPAWANVNELEMDTKIVRALISTLSQKDILTLTKDGGCGDGNVININEDFYALTGEFTEAGSPAYVYKNITVK